ncbi:MAG: tRNA uridine-5-carboxymethylaminomethyl(34) synthesis GTPase MnmE, partial [Bacteroidales bacterium]|nr:tRNA uridine-5-carboxymethylaminomethyl(34) synthesis GTPase MnmE [Bacteroidales bacterium]
MNLTDTIVAAATGEVQSALGMIRMSGRQATDIISKVFIPLDNKDFKTSAKANRLYYGRIVTAERMVAEKNGTPADSDGIIDECMVSVFKAPHSFTGEDTVEISHHGSLYIRRKILQLLIDNGARTAQRGEFSMRAFLNGKMNLSQTEAVADLINSENSSSHDLALKQLRGSYNEELKLLRQKFLKTASLLELEIDFSAEQEVFIDRKELEENLRSCIQRIESLLKSFKQGNAFKNGIPVAIVGKPNSGKSTLMNALLNDNRSIVSSTEGTTRDTIEEAINVNGIKVRFIDTAGLRNSDNEIEREGIKRSLEAVKKAQTVLYLADASRDDCESIEYQLAFLKQDVDLTGKRLILIV